MAAQRLDGLLEERREPVGQVGRYFEIHKLDSRVFLG
jgi:hypothetical protein